MDLFSLIPAGTRHSGFWLYIIALVIHLALAKLLGQEEKFLNLLLLVPFQQGGILELISLNVTSSSYLVIPLTAQGLVGIGRFPEQNESHGEFLSDVSTPYNLT